MTLFELASVLVVLAGVYSYLNHRYLKMPTTIGVMLVALASSMALVVFGRFAPGLRADAERLVSGVDFSGVLLHGMLAFLLFAGSLHVKLDDLFKEWAPISALTAFGTLMCTVAVGGVLYLVLPLFNLQAGLVSCLLFGALIAPTDAVAVLSIMKAAGAPKALETQVAGESLFNDGVAVVIFLAILEVATAGHAPTVLGAARMLVQEMGGGLLLGLAAGYVTYRMLRSIDNYQVEVLLTLGLCMGVYALAEAIHVSAPVAVVLAGLLVGNQGRRDAMSEAVEKHIDAFWELMDEIMNVILFMLMGLEILVMTFRFSFILAGVVAIAIVLLARWLSVAAIVTGLGGRKRFRRGTATVLTWCGLRGGVSIAMALSLPEGPTRDLFIAITYVVVIFSVIGQGLTIGKVVRHFTAPPPAPPNSGQASPEAGLDAGPTVPAPSPAPH